MPLFKKNVAINFEKSLIAWAITLLFHSEDALLPLFYVLGPMKCLSNESHAAFSVFKLGWDKIS